MQVMILAAGKSSRLGPLGALRPKPLVSICGYPAITYGIGLCAAAGLRDIVINLHHHGDQIRAAVGDGSRFGVKIEYSEEIDLLGTGGGLAHARHLFRPGPVLVMNGKVVADLDLGALCRAHNEAGAETQATMLLRDNPNPKLFPPISLDAHARVVGLRGERFGAPSGVQDFMFTGVHVISPALLDRLPAGESDILSAAYRPALLAGVRIQGMRLTGYFEEHSTPTRYLAGNLALLRQPTLLKAAPGPLTGVDPQAQVAQGATLIQPYRIAAAAVIEAGATVGPDVVVDAGGVVAAGARVTRAVVWAGGIARGEVADAIVTESGNVTDVAPAL
jgi:mannose-1-phosphate guanylyltransferase